MKEIVSLQEQKRGFNNVRIILVLLLILVLGMAFVFQEELFILMILYTVMLVIATLLYTNKITEKKQSKYIGIGRGHLVAILIGLAIGGAFLLLNRFNSAFALAAPILPLTLTGDVTNFVKIFIAPQTEEIFFNGGVFGFFQRHHT